MSISIFHKLSLIQKISIRAAFQEEKFLKMEKTKREKIFQKLLALISTLIFLPNEPLLV